MIEIASIQQKPVPATSCHPVLNMHAFLEQIYLDIKYRTQVMRDKGRALKERHVNGAMKHSPSNKDFGFYLRKAKTQVRYFR